jgi:hypothetical protein
MLDLCIIFGLVVYDLGDHLDGRSLDKVCLRDGLVLVQSVAEDGLTKDTSHAGNRPGALNEGTGRRAAAPSILAEARPGVAREGRGGRALERRIAPSRTWAASLGARGSGLVAAGGGGIRVLGLVHVCVCGQVLFSR